MSLNLQLGGVLRDDKGKFICLFFSSIPFMEINYAEIFAIERAIKISSINERITLSKIIIDFDSLNAVNCAMWLVSTHEI